MLKRFLVVLFGLIALALTAPMAVADSGGYISNNPRPNAASPVCNSKDQGACSLTNKLVARINSVSCQTGEIRVLWYSLGNYRYREALVAKAKCGTKVWLLTSRQKPDGEEDGVEPDGEMKLALQQVKAAGGKTMLGWGALARGGSHDSKKYKKGDDSAGIEHEKLVIIKDGHGGYWVETDSGNGTYSLDTDYNDRMEMNDSCLYKAAVKHYDLMWKDRYVKSEPVAKSCDGKRLIYWMPTSHTDPVLNWLKVAKCGKGDTIYLAPFYYAGGKANDYTDQVLRLKKSGATPEVAANSEGQHWSTYQKRRLVSNGVKVYYMTVYINGRLKYNHRKVLSEQGCDGAPFGSQGSTTTNYTAFEKNGNHVTVTRVTSDISAMHRGFKTMTGDKHVLTMKDVGCVGPVKKQPSGCKK